MAQDKDQKTLNVPPLRFPGFTDEWKKTTLGEIGKTFNGLTGKNSNDFGQGSPYITYKSIFDNSKVDISRVEYVTITDNERIKSAQNVVRLGDIFFTTSSETPTEVGMTSVLLDGIEDCYLNSFCFGYRLSNKEETLPEYFRFYLRASVIRNKLSILAQGSTRFNISKNEVMRMGINLPNSSEQEKIAALLSCIDERITTQNKIIEDLKKLKSAIIDKLLGRVQTAQSDRMVKLGEIGKFTRGLTYSAEDIVEDGGIVVVRANNLSNGEAVNFYNEIVRVDKPISGSQLLKYGDMVICMANGSSALVGKASYYNETTDSIATIGAFCGIYRSDKKIVRWLLQTNKYKRVIHKSLQGGNGAIANLTPNDILGLSFIIPKQEPSIVELLQGFDEKLDIEISLLHSLQKEKQYLLSQMFI